MQTTAVRFGLYGIFIILLLFAITWLLLRRADDYQTSEIVGWVSIVLSVLFVYFGLKYYRDKQNGGNLSFGEGMKLGLLIVLFPSLAFGIFNVLYVTVIDPAFMDKYYNYQVEQLTKSIPVSEADERVKELERQREMFGSPVVQFIVMFLSVFLTGLIVTVISTLILKRKVSQQAVS